MPPHRASSEDGGEGSDDTTTDEGSESSEGGGTRAEREEGMHTFHTHVQLPPGHGPTTSRKTHRVVVWCTHCKVRIRGQQCEKCGNRIGTTTRTHNTFDGRLTASVSEGEGDNPTQARAVPKVDTLPSTRWPHTQRKETRSASPGCSSHNDSPGVNKVHVDTPPCRCGSQYHCLAHQEIVDVTSNSVQAASEPRLRPPAAFPTQRRVVRRETDRTQDAETLELWAQEKEIAIGPSVPANQRHDVLQTIWTYRDLEATDVTNFMAGPPTDLITHRTRVKEGTPIYRAKRKMMSSDKEWWYRKFAIDGLEAGLFERTVVANGHLSQWGADPVLVTKPGKKEPRLTFNYHYVWEEPPGNQMQLSAEAHAFLSLPTHNCFSSFDLKHGYWAVQIHPDDRYLLAFSVPGLGQLQPTRMAQGARSSSFTMNELGCLAFGEIPTPNPEPSFLYNSRGSQYPPDMTFYIDDMFPAHSSWEKHWHFIKHHLFPRLLWAGLKLSFSKAKIGMDQIVALGELHLSGGRKCAKPERIRRILDWPEPQDQTGVRAFLGTTITVRPYIKSYAEIARPLSRLTGTKTEWRWEESERLAFILLKSKAAEKVMLFGWNPALSVELFSDASKFSTGCFVRQLQDGKWVPLLYDSFTFSTTERNYGTYKRELKALVTFSSKHSHMLVGPRTSIVWTDHKPLTGFLNSDTHEDIFFRFLEKLRPLNLRIQHIPGERNTAADGLSRTIFSGDCAPTPAVRQLLEAAEQHNHDAGRDWFWKSGKGGYEEMLRKLIPTPQDTGHDAPIVVGWTSFSTQTTRAGTSSRTIQCLGASPNTELEEGSDSESELSSPPDQWAEGEGEPTATRGQTRATRVRKRKRTHKVTVEKTEPIKGGCGNGTCSSPHDTKYGPLRRGLCTRCYARRRNALRQGIDDDSWRQSLAHELPIEYAEPIEGGCGNELCSSPHDLKHGILVRGLCNRCYERRRDALRQGIEDDRWKQKMQGRRDRENPRGYRGKVACSNELCKAPNRVKYGAKTKGLCTKCVKLAQDKQRDLLNKSACGNELCEQEDGVKYGRQRNGLCIACNGRRKRALLMGIDNESWRTKMPRFHIQDVPEGFVPVGDGCTNALCTAPMHVRHGRLDKTLCAKCYKQHVKALKGGLDDGGWRAIERNPEQVRREEGFLEMKARDLDQVYDDVRELATQTPADGKAVNEKLYGMKEILESMTGHTYRLMRKPKVRNQFLEDDDGILEDRDEPHSSEPHEDHAEPPRLRDTRTTNDVLMRENRDVAGDQDETLDPRLRPGYAGVVQHWQSAQGPEAKEGAAAGQLAGPPMRHGAPTVVNDYAEPTDHPAPSEFSFLQADLLQVQMEALSTTAEPGAVGEWAKLDEEWYGDLTRYYESQEIPQDWTRKQQALFKRRAKSFRYDERKRRLIHSFGNMWTPCVKAQDVARVLQATHDRLGHFNTNIVFRKLYGKVYWPTLTRDVHDYIKSCVKCALWAQRRRTEPLLSLDSLNFWEMVQADLMGPFPTSRRGNTMLLHVTCCFSSFSASRPLPDKASRTVRRALAELFDTLMDPAVLYTDLGLEFTSREMRGEMEGRGVYLTHAPAASHRPTGAIENANRILRRCLEKQLPLYVDNQNVPYNSMDDWDIAVHQSTKASNQRHVETMGYSPCEIAFGHTPGQLRDLELSYPTNRREQLTELAKTHTPIQLPTSDLAQACFEAQGERAHDRHHARQLKRSTREKREQLYNSSINTPPIREGDIVFSQVGVEILSGFKSVKPRWVGPYRVVSIKGDHEKAAELESLTKVGKQHSRHIVRHLGMLRVYVPRPRRLRPEGDGDDVDWKKLVEGDRTQGRE